MKDIYTDSSQQITQVTNPSIDPLREPMELRTFLGRKPDYLELEMKDNGDVKIKTEIYPNLVVETPILFTGMSFGAISYNAFLSLAMAAKGFGNFCRIFGFDVDEVLGGEFLKLKPVTKRPYGKIYAY